MKRLILFFVTILVLSNCGPKMMERSGNIIVIYPSAKDKGAVRLTVIDEDILKVESSASSTFDTTRSLIETEYLASISFNVAETDTMVSITTPKLIVHIDKADGKVGFYDLQGKSILQEEEKNSSQFTPIEIDGSKGYTLLQRFQSSEDEALYGLGQHQADEINYKGKNEELFQYNTKVSIPFVVSTKKYGILWDNYSLTRFGDPKPHSNLDQFVQYDKNGEPGGLTATYIDDQLTGHVFIEKKESTIDYENLETIKNFPEGFNFSNAKITWEGFLESPESGIYRFLCYYAGYTKLWIDGDLKFYKWRTAWNPSVAKFTVNMQPGVRHHIKLEWIPDGGVSYIGLKALSPVAPEKQSQITFSSELGTDIRYFFIAGKNLDEVISGYRKVTGKAQVMPLWSMGFWQSRERYKTQNEILECLKEYRNRQIPIDNIVLDWSHWQVDQWGSHEFAPDRFPDPAGMVQEIHNLHGHIMVSVWPKYYINTQHYKDFNDKGWMYRKAVEDSIRDWIYPGYIGSFYDAYNPEARNLFWQQIKEGYYEKGFDAWWLDATEPDILSNASIAYRKELMNPTALGPATKYFNAYALQNAKGIYEGQRSEKNNERVFILTRSGFAGIQRYGAVTWSGDIGTRWEDMKSQISAGINFAMSGLPYWTMDIGGFCVEKRYEKAAEGSEDMKEWRELNTRWFQFGAFVPLFRSHGQYPFREIFNLAPDGSPTYNSMVYYDKLRYRLMPYIYSLSGWAYVKDYTIMRGLAMDFIDDEMVYNIGDQYMFGPALLVNPVYEYNKRDRSVYLPESSGWYDCYTGELFEGGQRLVVDAPYEKIPLFIKAGSILPLGPEIQYTGEKPADPITIYVYTGADAQFDLYEDEGINYNYEKGNYSIIPITWLQDSKTLTMGERKGTFDGMLQNRTFRVVFISAGNRISIDDQKASAHEVLYSGGSMSITME